VPLRIDLVEVAECGPFTHRWPDAVEPFERCWDIEVRVDGQLARLRHGLGEREVYGRRRAHSVTFLRSQPVVEGVAADDHERSRALLSLIKGPDGRMVRRVEDLPPGYEGLPVVDHASEIQAPYTKRGLAVKVREDDLEAWVRLAILRVRTRRPGRRPPEDRMTSLGASVGADRSTGSRPSAADRAGKAAGGKHELAPPEVRAAVARELARYEEELNGPLRRGERPLTEDSAADRFVHEHPLAFLLAVVMDQGVPYQRAWRAPLELHRRLGHLDPARMVADPAAVAEAVRRPPALHRFVNVVPRWIVSACRRVLEDYGGDAAAIWAGAPQADVLLRRLLAFDGIGQKKAAMSVMLLWRSVGVEVTHMERSDVAVDVHVRRVFLRSGLVESDDPVSIILAARELWPDLPAALDSPAWSVGITWCRPTAPECSACRLSDVCPRYIDRGRGVGGP
jgi:uncharacterized HhH-GPD family protein